jgi:hypothetical protein
MTLLELRSFFQNIVLPETLIINRGETITDIQKCIDGHFKVLEAHPDSKASEPFYDRLIKIKELLSHE